MNRLGHRLLALGGCLLAGLMVYTLVGHGGRSGVGWAWVASGPAVDVAVFFPDRPSWTDFRQAVHACAGSQRLRVVADSEDSVLVETAGHRTRVRFRWHDVRGLRETRAEVRRLARSDRPPLALVGSGNTVLTIALAEELRDLEREGGTAVPVLLVPWATTVLAERPEPGSGPVAFLDIYSGRTFRFCPNNQGLADLVVGCLIDHDPGPTLERAEIVVDRHDPYSVDLADSFHRVIERRAPTAELTERVEGLASPGLGFLPGLPSDAEDALAASICREARSLGSKQVLWAVLPLQEEPARRLLQALQRHARFENTRDGGPLRVVCGDGIGAATLFKIAGKCPFPVWCFSSAAPPDENRPSGPALALDDQVLAEIVSALVTGLDRPSRRAPTADGLRDALARLKLGPHDPGAFGRSLSFDSSGERQAADFGLVLSIAPGRDEVLAWARAPSGRWNATPLKSPSAVATRP